MKQNPVKGEKNLYRCYGFECSGGWYPLLRERCGAEGTLRKDGGFTWILTLCDACQEKRLKERGSKRKELEALIKRFKNE